MSSYNMASMHSKWSKNVAIPTSGTFGNPEGTSVADCLNWGSVYRPQPPLQPKSEVQLLNEETNERRTYVTRTPGPPAERGFYRSCDPAPHEAIHEVVTSTKHRVKERPQTPMRAQTPIIEDMEGIRYDAPASDEYNAGVLSIRGTHRDVGRPKSAVVYSSANLETPPSFREVINENSSGRRSSKRFMKERAPTPPMTFRDYLKERQRPPTPGGYQQMTSMLNDKKFGNYPHYYVPPTPENIDYIVSQSEKAVAQRPATPGPRGTSRGIQPKYLVNGHRSLIPASTDDILKEKALIEAMREHLYNGQQRNGHISYKPPTGRSPPKYRVSSRKEETGLVDYKPERPHTTNDMEFYKAMYKNSPAAMKMVGFSPEDEYHTYEAYRATPQLREAWNGSSDHFREWEDTTKAMARRPASQHWKNKYKHTKSKVDHKWKHGVPEAPGKVSVELDCPDRADMNVSLRVRNTPVPTY